MIRKWPMEVGAECLMPASTQVIHVGEQDGRLFIWTRDLSVKTTRYEVSIYGTGMTPPDSAEHLRTLQASDGLVWHLFGQALPS
jgi:hypothetical protein